MADEDNKVVDVQEEKKQKLNRRFETIGWGLFLIMIGGIGLVPKDRVPEGTWIVGVGIIMLGLNLARYLTGIKMSVFTIVLGIVALAVGGSAFYGIELPLFAILIIIIGISIIVRLLFEKE